MNEPNLNAQHSGDNSHYGAGVKYEYTSPTKVEIGGTGEAGTLGSKNASSHLEQQKAKARELIDLELDNLATDCVIENEVCIPREQRITYTKKYNTKFATSSKPPTKLPLRRWCGLQRGWRFIQ